MGQEELVAVQAHTCRGCYGWLAMINAGWTGENLHCSTFGRSNGASVKKKKK